MAGHTSGWGKCRTALWADHALSGSGANRPVFEVGQRLRLGEPETKLGSQAMQGSGSESGRAGLLEYTDSALLVHGMRLVIDHGAIQTL